MDSIDEAAYTTNLVVTLRHNRPLRPDELEQITGNIHEHICEEVGGSLYGFDALKDWGIKTEETAAVPSAPPSALEREMERIAQAAREGGAV